MTTIVITVRRMRSVAGDATLRRPSELVRFDSMAAIPTFYCNMVFQNVQECRDALAKYAIMKGLQIHYLKNDQVRIRVRCTKKCPWTFLASKDSHNTDFTMKTYVPKHDYHRKIPTQWLLAKIWLNS